MGHAPDSGDLVLPQRLPHPGRGVVMVGVKLEQQLAQQTLVVAHAGQRPLQIDTRQLRKADTVSVGRFPRSGDGFRGRLEPSAKHLEELVGLDGFGQVIVHSRLERFVAITGHGVGGHGDDGQIAETFVGADVPGCLESVHFRQLDVHQHQVVSVPAHRLDRLPAVSGDVHSQAEALQHGDGHLLVDLVVFHQENLAIQLFPFPFGLVRPSLPGGCGRTHQDVGNGLEEHRGAHRLDEEGVHLLLPRTVHDLLSPVGGDHDDGRHLFQPRVTADQARGFDAIQAGHLPVDQDQVTG